MNIHVTDRAAFRRCRRRWAYDREGLKPVSESRGALWFGRGVHYALAEHYRGKDAFKGLEEWLDLVLPREAYLAMSSQEKQDFEETRDLMIGVLKNYMRKYEEIDKEWTVVAVEKPFKVRIPGTYGYLIGTLDLLVKWRKRLWVVDHKNFKEFAAPEYLEIDDQMTAYMWLVKQVFGQTPAGAIYNQIRKKLPSVPQVLKSGQALSKAACDTTYQVYLDTIYEHGFDPGDYSEMLSKLAAEDDKFFRRAPIARNAQELLTFEENLTAEYREMTSRRLPIYPNPVKECLYDCSYRILCKAQNERGDVDGIKKALYIVDHSRGI